MIKINLLTAGAAMPVAKPVSAAAPASGMRNFLIFVVSALMAGGTVVGFYTIWSKDVARLQQDLKKEQLREAELRGIQEQNRRYQQQLQQLEVRINTIQTLQNSKSGPVAFMTALADVVNRTGDLYLFSVTPEGERLAMKGQSSTVESMAQFIAALKHSGSFQDVQLRQYWEDDQQNRVAYKFNLDCIYRSPATVAPAAAPGTQRAGM